MAFSYIWVGRAGLDFPPVGVARIGLGHYLLPGWAERALIFPRGAGADKVELYLLPGWAERALIFPRGGQRLSLFLVE